MRSIYQSAFLEALGWSLVDSLWQMGFIWTLYSLFTLNGKKFSSSKKHNLALFGIAIGTIWFFITLAFQYHYALDKENGYRLSYFIKAGLGALSNSERWMKTVIPFLSFLYLLTAGIFSFRLLIQFRYHQAVCHKELMEPGAHIIHYTNALCEKIGITRNVRIKASRKIAAPLAIGFFRPLILLPLAAVSRLTTAQVESIVAHELFHIRRNDYLMNLLLMMSELILFFNPFARMLSGIVRKERENSCDDEVVAMGFCAWDYSNALYLLGKYQLSMNNRLVLAATGSGKGLLLQRIQRLMKISHPSPSLIKPLSAFFLCLALAILAGRKPQPPVASPAAQTAHQAVVKKDHAADEQPGKTMIYEEKQVVPSPQKPVVVKKIKKKVHAYTKTVIIHEGASPDVASGPADETNNINAVVSFINETKALEFSIIGHTPSTPPKPAIGGRALPYIPEATFYSPATASDTLKPKVRKVISL